MFLYTTYRNWLVCFMLALFASPGSAMADKTLHWDRIEVLAQLDRDGRLTISERQYMVFNGDWNGGERFFATHGRQRFTLLEMNSIDPATGRPAPMVSGDLSQVDEYAEVSPGKIRWRSRLPSDPPFQSALRVYEITGAYDGVVTEQDGNRYVLDHDFAFKERPGMIRQFDLTVILDPVWRNEQSVELVRHARNLAPGASFPLQLTLTYTGQSKPEHTVQQADSPLLQQVLQLLIIFAIVRLLIFLWHEQSKGKFRRVISADSIDTHWLQLNLLKRAPEEAGTQLALRCHGPQLAAALLRLVRTGKLDSDKPAGELGKLSIPQRRPSYSAYEEKLIATLFAGQPSLDTEILRAQDNRQKLKKAMAVVEEQYLADPIFQPRLGPILILSRLLTLSFLGGAIYFGFLTTQQFVNIQDDSDIVAQFFASLFPTVLGLVILSIPARLASRSPSFAYVALTILALLMLGYFTAVYAILGAIDAPLPATGYLFSLLLAATVFNMVINIASSKLHPDAIALHRLLRGAVHHFSRAMQQDITNIRDEWWPYILAFGQGKEAQRWIARRDDSVDDRDDSWDSTSPSNYTEHSWEHGVRSMTIWAGLGSAMDVALRPESSSSSSDSDSDSSSSSSGGGSGGGW